MSAVIRIPMYSMRSYSTTEYAILKDGNVKLHLNRMNTDTDYLVIPDNVSDFDEFMSLGLVDKESIIVCKYGSNAVDTRKVFWKHNVDLIDSYNLPIVTDITGYNGAMPFENNFNITKLPGLARSYIDEFWESDLDSMRRAQKTTVLNQVQADYIIKTDPSLIDKVVVDQKSVSSEYFNSVGLERYDIDVNRFRNGIFFPFRLSDPEYSFIKTLAKYSDKEFFITDPNESYNLECDNVTMIKPSKKQYYWLLSLQPTVVYNANPSLVYHPGLADFIWFDCNIVSDHTIPSLGDVT